MRRLFSEMFFSDYCRTCQTWGLVIPGAAAVGLCVYLPSLAGRKRPWLTAVQTGGRTEAGGNGV